MLSIAAGPSLPASSGPASYDALFILRSVLFRYVMQLGRTLTLRAAFASSTYLLPQIPGPACLNPPNPLSKGAHQASERTGAHGHRFAVLRPASEDALVAFLTVLLRYVVPLDQTLTLRLAFSSFIDIVPNCGPSSGKSSLCSGGFAIRRGLCRCSACRIARLHLAPIKV